MNVESLRQSYVSGDIELEEFESRIGAYLRDDWGRETSPNVRVVDPRTVWTRSFLIISVACAIILVIGLGVVVPAIIVLFAVYTGISIGRRSGT